MSPRTDTCPECSTRRTELVVAPGRFYCPHCQLAGEGPAPARAGEQLSLDQVGEAA